MKGSNKRKRIKKVRKKDVFRSSSPEPPPPSSSSSSTAGSPAGSAVSGTRTCLTTEQLEYLVREIFNNGGLGIFEGSEHVLAKLLDASISDPNKTRPKRQRLKKLFGERGQQPLRKTIATRVYQWRKDPEQYNRMVQSLGLVKAEEDDDGGEEDSIVMVPNELVFSPLVSSPSASTLSLPFSQLNLESE